MMLYIVFIVLFIYYFYVFGWIWGWIKTENTVTENIKSEIKISIIIPCRNEEKNVCEIAECLKYQTCNLLVVEVIFVNDHSTDFTQQKLQDASKILKSGNIKCKILDLGNGEFGKKAAITKAISEATGEIILCTDADCRMGKKWLISMVSEFNNSDTLMVSAPVEYNDKKGCANSLLQLDFISLIGVGAASIKNNKPTMCNGANIAYRKSVFNEVNGFEGNEHIPSGDDEFLMQKIYNKYKKGIMFLKNYDALVITNAPESIAELINQRLRWASKAGHYSNILTKFLPYFIFIIYILLFTTVIEFAFFGDYSNFIVLFSGKLIIDFVFFLIILKFFKRRKLLYYLIPAQFFHLIYIITLGIFSFTGKYKWKGRNFTKVQLL